MEITKTKLQPENTDNNILPERADVFGFPPLEFLLIAIIMSVAVVTVFASLR